MQNANRGIWENKKVLFIGDSLTEHRVFPERIREILGIEPFYHCKGGAGLIAMVDGDRGLGGHYDDDTDAHGVLRPLSADMVANIDLIVFYGGYNCRHFPVGQLGDRYDAVSGSGTVAGMMQYGIDRIYEELEKANNLTCKLLIVTVDYSGKYPWVDVDGKGEFGYVGSGQTLEAMADMQVAVAKSNNLPVCDLFHTSGINPKTWCVFGADPKPIDNSFSQYLLDENGKPTSLERMRYVKGESYYQWRDGKVVLEKYLGFSTEHHDAPFPYYGDQLHKSKAGYFRIGECIAGAIISAYGK